MKELHTNQTDLLEKEKNARLVEIAEMLQEQILRKLAKWESQHKTFAMVDRVRDSIAATFNVSKDIFYLNIGKAKKTISLEMEEQIRGRDEA